MVLLSEALSPQQTKALEERFGCFVIPTPEQQPLRSENAGSRRKQDGKEPPANMVVGEVTVSVGGCDIPLRVVATDHFFSRVNGDRRFERITPREVWELVEQIYNAMLTDFLREYGRIFSLPVPCRIREARERRHDFGCIVQSPTSRLNVVGILRWDEIRHDGLAFVLCTAKRKPIEGFFTLDPNDHIYRLPATRDPRRSALTQWWWQN